MINNTDERPRFDRGFEVLETSGERPRTFNRCWQNSTCLCAANQWLGQSSILVQQWYLTFHRLRRLFILWVRRLDWLRSDADSQAWIKTLPNKWSGRRYVYDGAAIMGEWRFFDLPCSLCLTVCALTAWLDFALNAGSASLPLFKQSDFNTFRRIPERWFTTFMGQKYGEDQKNQPPYRTS